MLEKFQYVKIFKKFLNKYLRAFPKGLHSDDRGGAERKAIGGGEIG